jgi:sphingomyelin phosphodiesterase acid-like 3
VKPFGDYFCDTPETLVQSALSFISSNYSNFVIYSGDSAPHVNVSSWEEAFNKTKIVTNLLKQYLPTTRVLPCLGNADFYPTNYAPFQEPFDVYRQVGELWSSWLEPSSLETFSTGGYYSQLIEPGLRILVLNTNLYYNVKRQYPYTMNMSDPANQFMWMESVLNSSRANNEKVLIVGHVPPGMFERAAGFVVKEGWFYDKFNERYVSIIRSHCNTIVGQLFGHEHSDSFKIVFSKDNQTACNAIMINPSIGMWNPNQNVNSSKPAIRAYSYDPITKMLKNYTQYSANIDNATFSGNLTWTIEVCHNYFSD